MHEERGAGLVEWALVVMLIAIFAMGAVKTFGTELSSTYGEAATAIEQAGETQASEEEGEESEEGEETEDPDNPACEKSENKPKFCGP